MKSMCKKSIDAEHVKVSQNMFYTTIQNSTKRKKKETYASTDIFSKNKGSGKQLQFSCS